MYETKAFWGKESNQNINTINNSMNFLSANNILPVVIVVVVLFLALCMLGTVRSAF